ncbi:MAG: M20 family metallopeptidase [Bacillota bacterium]
MHTAVLDYIDSHAERAVHLLQRLVQARSVFGNEERVAAILLPELERLGFAVENHPVEPERPNLIATYRGAGGGPRLLCYSHMDTVGPGDLSAWTADPFGGEVRDGKIWGRGTCDHKGEIAALLIAWEALRAAGFQPRGDLLYIFDSDEERGGDKGMKHLVEKNLYQADFGLYACTTQISPESRPHFGMAGDSNIIGAAMGAQVFRVTVEGERTPRENLMYPPGRPTALECAIPLMNALRDYGQEVSQRVCPLTGPSRLSLTGLEYEPSPLVGQPDRLHFLVVRRLNLLEDLVQERQKIEAIVSAHSAAVSLVRERPQTRVPEAMPVVAAVRRAAVAVDGIEPRFTGAPALTGLGWFVHEKGLPIVMFGYGNLDFHHSHDEHLAIEDLIKSAKVYALAIADLIG